MLHGVAKHDSIRRVSKTTITSNNRAKEKIFRPKNNVFRALIGSPTDKMMSPILKKLIAVKKFDKKNQKVKNKLLELESLNSYS
ncbi:uncharacterized protein PRCAT00005371001 [Priceomyces carsonii]|uniref:uncharacterized protein n=1 Tax=Priceomyces carsonii TaxID=28549 RepID=UPI002EDA7115|nr:unnamed protein product [Priceomyces carsonii]